MGKIYKITNTLTNKSYIGLTTKKVVQERFKQHLVDAKHNRFNGHFHNAIRKYGEECWIICVLEDNIPKEKLSEKEIYYIAKYNTYVEGYNSTTGGEGTCNLIRSKEWCEKMSKVHKGKTLSEETKEKLRQANIGKKQSAETIRKRIETMDSHSTGNPAFKSWVYINADNIVVIVTDKTKAEFAAEYWFANSYVQKQSKKTKEGKAIKTGPFVGYKFFNDIEDYSCFCEGEGAWVAS